MHQTGTALVAIESPAYPEVYSEPRLTSNMEHFAKTVIGCKPLTTLKKNSILDVVQGSEYASMYQNLKFVKHR